MFEWWPVVPLAGPTLQFASVRAQRSLLPCRLLTEWLRVRSHPVLVLLVRRAGGHRHPLLLLLPLCVGGAAEIAHRRTMMVRGELRLRSLVREVGCCL